MILKLTRYYFFKKKKNIPSYFNLVFMKNLIIMKPFLISQDMKHLERSTLVFMHLQEENLTVNELF